MDCESPTPPTPEAQGIRGGAQKRGRPRKRSRPDESRTVTIKEAACGGRVTRTQRVPRLLSFSLKWTVMAGEGSGHYLTTGTYWLAMPGSLTRYP